MTYKASRKKIYSDEDYDYYFAPKRALAVCGTDTGSIRRSPRIKLITDMYKEYDSTTSSELEMESSDNSSCDSYHINAESVEEADYPSSIGTWNSRRKRSKIKTYHINAESVEEADYPSGIGTWNNRRKRSKIKTYHINAESVEEADYPSSIGTWNNRRKRSKIKKRRAMKSDMLKEKFELDKLLISLKAKKRRKLFRSTENSSVYKVWISREASYLESNNVTEGEDENVEIVSDKNIFDSGISVLTHFLSSGIVQICDDVKCNVKANLMTDALTSASDIERNVTVVNSIDFNNTHDVTASESKSFASIFVSNNKSNVTAIISAEANSALDVSAAVNCSMEVRPVANVSTSISKIKNNVEVFNSVETNNIHDVSAPDKHTTPSVEGYNSSDKVIMMFEGVLGDSYDTSISIQSQNRRVDEVELIEIASQTCIVQSNEEHFKIGRSINGPDTCDIVPSYSESSTWTSSEMKLSLVDVEELNNENELKSNQEANHEVPNYPKNLLQNRKEFSPISQEKLCWYDDELDDTIEALGHVTDSIPSPEITKRRVKKNKKLPHRPKDCSGGNSLYVHTSVNTPSQKAVLFSQRQMQDIETIASKLLKEMSCLKDIVADVMNADNVASEAHIFSFSKFTPQEVTAAVGSASNLEATTKKWLTMMSKDCKRFCKIMSSTDSNVSTPVIASKQCRKVTFADEAGGSLCNVKVFEQPPTADTQVEPKNDGPTAN